MNRPLTPTRSRAWTAVWLATAVLAGTSLTTGNARAQDAAGTAPMVQVEAQPQPAAPRSQPIAIPREDGPRVITRWQPGEPVPAGYHPAQRPRTGAIVGGAVTLGVLYMLSAFIAAVGTDVANASHGSNPVSGLFVPVVGPFLTMTQSSSATADLFLVLDGAGQTAGAIFLVWGVTSPQNVLMRDGYAQPRLVPRPMLLGKDGAGFGLSGTF